MMSLRVTVVAAVVASLTAMVPTKASARISNLNGYALTSNYHRPGFDYYCTATKGESSITKMVSVSGQYTFGRFELGEFSPGDTVKYHFQGPNPGDSSNMSFVVTDTVSSNVSVQPICVDAASNPNHAFTASFNIIDTSGTSGAWRVTAWLKGYPTDTTWVPAPPGYPISDSAIVNLENLLHQALDGDTACYRITREGILAYTLVRLPVDTSWGDAKRYPPVVFPESNAVSIRETSPLVQTYFLREHAGPVFTEGLKECVARDVAGRIVTNPCSQGVYFVGNGRRTRKVVVY